MTWVEHGPAGEGRPNILASHSLNPEALDAHVQLYRVVMFGASGLSRAEREAMAVAVSVANDCHYWIVHHSAALVRESGDPALAEAVVSGHHDELPSRLVALLRYAVKLTREPAHMVEDDVDALRAHGLSDRDVVDANQVVAYYNYVNRVADGLGVELEDGTRWIIHPATGSKWQMAPLRMRLEHRWSQPRMSDYVDGDMSPRERERLERHADLCPECGPLRRALFWLVVELRELRRPPEHSIAQDVIERLRATEPDHAQSGTGSWAMPGRRRKADATTAGALWLRFGAVSDDRARPRDPAGAAPRGGVADEGLVRLAQEGRREAFEELVRRHADRLYGVVLRFSGDAAEAEEVVQETFLRAWRGIGNFERRAQFFTWLYRIGLNEAKRRAARRPPTNALSVEEGALEGVPDLRQAPEPQVEQRDVRAALERAVRALPVNYRAPLILRDVEGLSTQQAAAIMGLREAAFKSRLHRARLAVRKAIEDHLVEDG